MPNQHDVIVDKISPEMVYLVNKRPEIQHQKNQQQKLYLTLGKIAANINLAHIEINTKLKTAP